MKVDFRTLCEHGWARWQEMQWARGEAGRWPLCERISSLSFAVVLVRGRLTVLRPVAILRAAIRWYPERKRGAGR
eukprot:scaffold277613_cov31-Tisochrysis_lutea.AAC.2